MTEKVNRRATRRITELSTFVRDLDNFEPDEIKAVLLRINGKTDSQIGKRLGISAIAVGLMFKRNVRLRKLQIDIMTSILDASAFNTAQLGQLSDERLHEILSDPDSSRIDVLKAIKIVKDSNSKMAEILKVDDQLAELDNLVEKERLAAKGQSDLEGGHAEWLEN